VASMRQTSKLSRDQSDQVALPCGKQSSPSSSEPRGSLETTDDNNSESTEVCKHPAESEAKLTVTQLPEDRFPPRKLRSKRKRGRLPDPDYVDIAESPEAKLRKNLASERGKTTKLKKTKGALEDKIKELEAKVQQEQRQRKENFKQYVQKLKAAPVVAEDECALRQ